ncbi:MAG: YdcF family protein, partial [Cyanobacteriota bacterium]
MKNFYQKLNKYCSFALIAAAFPIMLGGGILIRLAIAYHQVPHPQAILTLGGDSKRSELAAQLALKNPSLAIWVSSGVRPEKADAIFQSAGIPRSRVHLDYDALDTVSNFTTMVDEFERRNIRHVYIVTSDYHMPRAKGIATFVLGSHGIAFTPVSMPTERPTEPKLFALLDMGRSMVWLV